MILILRQAGTAWHSDMLAPLSANIFHFDVNSSHSNFSVHMPSSEALADADVWPAWFLIKLTFCLES